MKIAQMTDLHIDDILADQCSIDLRDNFLNALASLSSRGVEKIILTGDTGSPDSIGWIFDTLKERGLEYEYVLGNHDEIGVYSQRSDFKRNREEATSYFHSLHDRDLYLYLDSSRSIIDAKQRRWMGTVLNSVNCRRVFLFIHHPIFDCGNTVMDRLYPLQNREEVAPLLLRQEREIYIFCGHYHTVHEQRIQNITQFVAPSMLVQVKQEGDGIELESKSYGYRIISIQKDAVETEVILLPPGSGQPKSHRGTGNLSPLKT